MKKILILLTLFIGLASYGQAEFEKIAITENVATAETSKIVSQQPGTGELNYINATALPLSNPTKDYVDANIPAEYAVIVYFNSTNPSTATIFDDENPPTVNDPLLDNDTDNLYIGTDASTWVYNGTIYVTKAIPASSNFKIIGTGVDAGNNKTSSVYREGSISSDAFVSSNAGMFINRNGSDTAQNGGFTAYSNATGSNINMFQLNASNGLDLWNYAASTWSRKFTFTGGGNLGVGETAPSDLLVVSKTVSTNTGQIRFGGSNGRTLSAYNNGSLANFDFMANLSYFSGNLGIGAQKYISLYNYAGTLPSYYQTIVDASENVSFRINGTNAYVISPNRNLLIATTTDNGVDKLQVNGSLIATTLKGGAALTGTPTAPTATAGTNTTQIATTAFVNASINSYIIQSQRTNTSFTLALTDAFTVIPVSSNGGYTITIPTNATVAFPIGTKIEVTQIAGGTGSYNIAGAGVTILGNIILYDGDYTTLIKVATNTWTITGQSKVAPIFSGAVTGAYFGCTNGSQGYNTPQGNRFRDSGSSLELYNQNDGTNTNPHFKFTPLYPFSSTPNASTGQVVRNVSFSSTYTAVGGDTSARILNFEPTINQTGGASGIIRAIYINPTLTSAADFRAIDVTSGKSMFQEIIANNVVRLKNYTVATLPTGVQGDTAYVTDALAPTYLVTVVGGGAVVAPVFYNGTSWVAH